MMKTATPKTRFSLILAAGLLVLAGAFTNVLPASAQAQEACPLPAGETPPADPPVTAQDVESGSATLAQFGQAATAQFERRGSETLTAQQIAYSGCRLRLEGGPWRSGSTYIVTLTLDGRVFLHAKDMSLSAGKLSPRIYGAILRELGIDLTDPATITSAKARAGASFSVPNVPGASGYAAVYVSVNSGRPIVLLAGFDLTASHLTDEAVDYGDPAVTASDVVDRESLKAFVTEALKFLISTQRGVLSTAESRAAFAKARLALRDPNGPWRHGSVYLYILDRTSNVIMFHGAFPDRFELKPLVPTVRDVVTGKLVLPQVIEAATSNPEGGFVEYYFDDPTDDSDSADIPKLGYARQFARTITTSNGTEITTNLIIGSGVYLRAPLADAARQNTVIESVLPQVMRVMTASTVDAVSSRVEHAVSDGEPAAELSFGGASTLSDAILANGHALESGTFELDRLLANSAFTLPLDAANNGSRGLFGNLTFWGSGDYRSISGGSPQSVGYDGSLVGANLGIDARLGDDVLAGLALSQAQGTVDYTASNVSGELTTSLTSVNPYLGWQMPGGLNLWAMAGFGTGEVEIDDVSAAAQASDLTQRMFAAGVSGPLMSSDEMIEGGTTNLRLKGEAAFTSADVEGSGTLESMSLSTSRQRLMLEGEHVQKLDSGATFTPSLELGLRNDGGDGETGTGIEAGGALRYADAESGLTVEGRVRTLLNHGGDYEETGVSGLVRIAPGGSGEGLALVVQPAWGQTGSGVDQLWENGVTAGVSPDNRARLNTEIGYGLGVAPGMGVVTPYAGLGLAGEGAQWWRMGARWQLAPAASVSVEGSLYETADDDGPARGLMLRGALRW